MRIFKELQATITPNRHSVFMEQILCCPKCQSTQITANKKGFSGKKAVAGALLTGGIGLLAGTLGSNKIILTCLACGHKFKPGQGEIKNITSTVESSHSQIQNTTEPTFQKEKDQRTGCVAVIIVLLILGFLSEKFGCNKFNDSNKTVPVVTIISPPKLSHADSTTIGVELVNILKTVNAANVEPRKALKQFSKYAAGLSNFSSNISQVFQAVKIARHKMETAALDISNIVLPKMLPQQMKDSLSAALSTINSSYLTSSDAFDEAMKLAKNPSDNYRVEVFRDDLNQATEMYAQAVLTILQIQSQFRTTQGK